MLLFHGYVTSEVVAITKSQLKDYFLETLAVDVTPVIWQPSRRLPLFLRDGYTYYEIDVLGTKCLVMNDQEVDRSAATIQKHIEQVRGKWNGEIIYARDQVTSLERKRLIERKIPFVVPGNQMYLPMLGIDLREHFRRLRKEVVKFSPAAQATFLLLLVDQPGHSYDAQEVADRLGYSKMTASRSMNELKAAKLGVIIIEGRTRRLQFAGNRRELWQRSLQYLDTPAKQTYYMRSLHTKPKGPRAGLTALANYSMLAEPPTPTIALTVDEWKEFESQYGAVLAKATDPDATEIEVWSYDPKLFAKDDCVDRFSLFLSRKDDSDERVQMAAEEMMEAIKW